jgi:elongation factor Ts
VASEGVIEVYTHGEGRLAVMVELNCETDFVGKTDTFKAMVKDIAMHVAATNPTYLSPEDIPEDVIEAEQGIYRDQALASGKPEKVVNRIIDGKVTKFYEEVCLLNQKFVKDMDITIQTLVNNMIASTGENIVVRRFARFQLGEDI